MINTKKIINSSLKTSVNILEDFSSPLSKRIGFIKGPSPVIPIFFYRYIGIVSNENKYYEEIRELDKKLSNLGDSYLKFTRSIPITRNDKIISKTQDVWQKKSSFNSSDKVYLINDLIKANVLSMPNNKLISSTMEEAFGFIVDLYLTKEQGVNLTKIKNFTLKLLTWINSFLPTFYRDVDYANETNDIYNPKVLFYGDIKKHEVYFLMFLSKLGCDILYVNPNSDGAFQTLDPKEQFSKFHRLPHTGAIKDPNELFKSARKNTTSPQSKSPKDMGDSLALNVISSQNIINASLKTSNDPFKDVFEPLDKRPGFVGLPLPLVPTYFYRYIGINEGEDKYYNMLFKLNEQLENFNDLYIRFNKNIPLSTKNDLITNTQMVWKNINEFDTSKKDLLISLLIKANVFPKLNDSLLESTFVNAFALVVELFLKTERDVNLSKVKNFSLKILTWSHHFIPNLIKGFDLHRNSDSALYNPKILYYGDIKKHGVLFLILLSKLGCDILYVNSSKDEAFFEHQDLQIYSKLIEFPNKNSLREFPTEEVLLREETTAFKASREISTIIHNEEDGVYKPWQFESYKTHPITLKTTFDELKILWNEDARMRGGFKVQNKTVYIPNLFAKISGVHYDLNIYWNEVKSFKSTENTLFVSKVPFSKTTFKQSDLYTCAYLINKDGLIDKRALLQNNVYKFSYLKTSLQDTIIEKINLLFKISSFKKSVDKEFKLKILMTILSIDKEILELIQRFDYPAKVPKLIIYDKNENLFNDEDSIILSFLNLMGFDILILTPPGYNNIEQKIHEKYYDIHKLETVKFDLELPNFDSIDGPKKEGSKSFWAGLFSGR